MATPLSRREDARSHDKKDLLRSDPTINPGHWVMMRIVQAVFKFQKYIHYESKRFFLRKRRKQKSKMKCQLHWMNWKIIQRLRHRHASTIYRRSWSGVLLRSDSTTKLGFRTVIIIRTKIQSNWHISKTDSLLHSNSTTKPGQGIYDGDFTSRVQIPKIYPLQLNKLLPEIKKTTEITNEIAIPHTTLEDHSQKLGYWHAFKTYGRNWLDELLPRNPTTKLGQTRSYY